MVLMWCVSDGISHELRALELGEDVRIDLTVCATVSFAEEAKGWVCIGLRRWICGRVAISRLSC
jgi:hypothetical protein